MTLLALSESTITLLVIAGIAAVVLMWGIGIYNQLVTLSQRFKNGFAQIDVQLKRRYDLIPNIVETAKGAMAHERETLEAVISARNRAASAASTAAANPGDAAAIGSLGAAESALTFSHWPRPIPISRPTKTCSPSRKNSPAPKTRWPLPGRHSTTP